MDDLKMKRIFDTIGWAILVIFYVGLIYGLLFRNEVRERRALKIKTKVTIRTTVTQKKDVIPHVCAGCCAFTTNKGPLCDRCLSRKSITGE